MIITILGTQMDVAGTASPGKTLTGGGSVGPVCLDQGANKRNKMDNFDG